MSFEIVRCIVLLNNDPCSYCPRGDKLAGRVLGVTDLLSSISNRYNAKGVFSRVGVLYPASRSGSSDLSGTRGLQVVACDQEGGITTLASRAWELLGCLSY